MLHIFNASICWQMGWVKVYEYDLGFYILNTLAQVNPNEKINKWKAHNGSI
jgi:hypothetical protein